MNFNIIYTEEELIKQLELVKEAGVFSYDIETAPYAKYLYMDKAALDPHLSFISTLSFAYNEEEGFVAPIKHLVGRNYEGYNLWDLIRKVFVNPSIIKIAYNLIFESSHMTKHDLFPVNVADPMVMAIRCKQILEPKTLDKAFILKGMGLKAQSLKIFGYEMSNFSDTLGDLPSFAHLDIEQGAKYSAEDSIMSLKLFNYWKKKAEGIKISKLCNGIDVGKRPYSNYYEFLHNVEMPVLRVIGFMQYQGLGYDLDMANKRLQEAEVNTSIAVQKIKDIGLKYGVKVEPGKTGKTKAVRELLFDLLRCPIAGVSTKTGACSLDDESIHDMLYMLEGNLKYNEIYCGDDYKELKKRIGKPYANKEDIAELLQAIMIVQKNGTLVNSHIKGRLKYINPETTRIHSNYGIWTDTSRFSSSSPNFQNVARADNDILGVRNMFKPDDGCVWVLIDFSGQEVRLGAELYKDETLINAIKHNLDIHSITANAAFDLGRDLSDGSRVEKHYRNPAKPIYFTASYGGTGKALQKNYKKMNIYIDRKEAQKRIDSLKIAYPRMAEYETKVIEFVKEHGYIEELLGYRRMLPEINSTDKYTRESTERKCANTTIQGTAASVTKMALNRVYDCYINGELDPSKVKIIGTIHDEIVFEITKMPLVELDKVVKLLQRKMSEDIIEEQILHQEAEADIADILGVYGKPNGWGDKTSFEKWKEAVE